MRRYLARAPKKQYPEPIRIVHNFYPRSRPPRRLWKKPETRGVI